MMSPLRYDGIWRRLTSRSERPPHGVVVLVAGGGAGDEPVVAVLGQDGVWQVAWTGELLQEAPLCWTPVPRLPLPLAYART